MTENKEWSWKNGLLKAVNDSTDNWTIISFALSALLMGTVLGFVEAAVLLLGIALHELGHIVAAVRQDIRVLPTRFIPFVGGIARTHGWAKTAADEVAIALAGPVVGAMVAATLLFLAYLLESEWVAKLGMIQAGINLFNLLPIYPLDGGRVAKAVTRSSGPKLMAAHAVASMVLAIVAAVYLNAPIFFVVALLSFGEWRGESRLRKELEYWEAKKDFPLELALSAEEYAKLKETLELLRTLLGITPLCVRDFVLTALASVGLIATLVVLAFEGAMLANVVP